MNTTNTLTFTTEANGNITAVDGAGTVYSKVNGRYYRTTADGKKTRIGKDLCELTFEEIQYEIKMQEAQDSADTEAAKEYDQWAAEADAEYEARKALQEAKDRETEANYEASTKKSRKLGERIDGVASKARKPRRSKDIAFETTIALADDRIADVTLTAKQADFMRHLPDTHFWENGLDSCIWVDCLCDDIGGQFKNKPMTVGAMISTICEKGLGKRGRDESRKGKPTVFELTELGKAVAAELGVH